MSCWRSSKLGWFDNVDSIRSNSWSMVSSTLGTVGGGIVGGGLVDGGLVGGGIVGGGGMLGIVNGGSVGGGGKVGVVNGGIVGGGGGCVGGGMVGGGCVLGGSVGKVGKGGNVGKVGNSWASWGGAVCAWADDRLSPIVPVPTANTAASRRFHTSMLNLRSRADKSWRQGSTGWLARRARR